MATPVETAAFRLSWEIESWYAIELHMYIEYTDYADKTNPYTNVIDNKYIETGLGQRLLERCSHPHNGAEKLSISYSDGTRCADVAYRGGKGSAQTQVILKQSFFTEDRSAGDGRPVPLKNYYLERLPLHNMLLRKASHVGADRHLGRESDIFLFAGVLWAREPVDLVYCLDHETGAPLEIRCYDGPDARRRDLPSWVWDAESFEVVDGHHFPMYSLTVAYRAGTSEKQASWRWHVTQLRYNQEYPKSLFWPVIQPGAMVWDRLAQKNYQVPLPKDAALTKEREGVPVAEPIQARPPEGGMMVISTAGFGLGIAFVMIGLVTWWRRRRS
jgi:hypothetical protein